MRRLPIVARVTAAFAVSMTLLLTAVGFAVHEGLRAELTEALDDALETQVSAVARLIVVRGAAEPGLTVGIDDPGETFTQVVDARWRLLTSTRGLPLEPILTPAQAARANEGLTIRLRGVVVDDDEDPDDVDVRALQERGVEPFEEDRARVLARAVELGGERLTVLAGATFEDPDEALAQLEAVLLVGGPLALALMCLAGYAAIRGALRPVERMRREAAQISAGAPGARLPLPPADDELARLGRTLNEMLDRLERALARERALVADASHELRTPLAILRAELDVALAGSRSAAELEAAVLSASEEVDRLRSITESLLLLARSDAGELPLRREPVDAGELLERARARFAGRAAQLGRPLAVDAPAGLRLPGDRLRLDQALANLVDNAIAHGAGAIELVARRDGDAVELAVRDAGAGFPDAFAARAFERFSRAGGGRSGAGAGLGLAIVALVATAHGGSARIGDGAEVVMRLPAA